VFFLATSARHTLSQLLALLNQTILLRQLPSGLACFLYCKASMQSCLLKSINFRPTLIILSYLQNCWTLSVIAGYLGKIRIRYLELPLDKCLHCKFHCDNLNQRYIKICLLIKNCINLPLLSTNKLQVVLPATPVCYYAGGTG
jgi:hypothetical protein